MRRTTSPLRRHFAAVAVTGAAIVGLLSTPANAAGPPTSTSVSGSGAPDPLERTAAHFTYRFGRSATGSWDLTVRDPNGVTRYLENTSLTPGCTGKQLASPITVIRVPIPGFGPAQQTLVVSCGMDEGNDQTVSVFVGADRIGRLDFGAQSPNLTVKEMEGFPVLRAVVYRRIGLANGTRGTFPSVYSLPAFSLVGMRAVGAA